MTKVAEQTKKTNMSLMLLFASANFDKNRIVIAEHELSDTALTLWLEDRKDFKENIDDCLKVEVPIADFAKIIAEEGYNSYDGTLYSESGRPYAGRVVVNEPIAYYSDDATTYEMGCIREAVVEHLLKSLVKN